MQRYYHIFVNILCFHIPSRGAKSGKVLLFGCISVQIRVIFLCVPNILGFLLVFKETEIIQIHNTANKITLCHKTNSIVDVY